MTSRTKAILSLGGVFLAGALCGALLLGIVVRDRAHQAERLRDPEGFEQYFVERLKLTESQRDSLKDELERTYAELAGLRRSTADEYREVLDTLRQRISPQLTSEQRDLLTQVDLRFRQALPQERARPRRNRISPADNVPTPLPVPAKVPVRGDSVRTAFKQEKTKAQAPEPAGMKSPADSTIAKSSSSDSESDLTGLAERLRERLDLKEDQAQQVDVIVRQTRQRFRRARTDLADDPVMLRAAVRRNLREMDQRIVALLTSEQMGRYEVMRDEMRERMNKRLKRVQ